MTEIVELPYGRIAKLYPEMWLVLSAEGEHLFRLPPEFPQEHIDTAVSVYGRGVLAGTEQLRSQLRRMIRAQGID